MNFIKGHRRSIRLKGYDYSQQGAYFVTICSHDRECLFGEIVDGKMVLNDVGKIVETCWHNIPNNFPNAELDAFVVMPNHVHGIICIVGAPLAGAQNAGAQNGTQNNRAPARGAPTVGDIVGAYKSLCVHNCLKWIKQNEPDRVLGKFWQRNYYEHVIRNEKSLDQIREYIINNPANWQGDEMNPAVRAPLAGAPNNATNTTRATARVAPTGDKP
ncbi:MAG: transposase [Deltaproteobacteria bacterium]|nr:transposase [Deltaproteobacteria bacterium]